MRAEYRLVEFRRLLPIELVEDTASLGFDYCVDRSSRSMVAAHLGTAGLGRDVVPRFAPDDATAGCEGGTA